MTGTIDCVAGDPVRPVTPLGILVEQLEAIVSQAEQAAISAELMSKLRTAYQLAAGLDPYVEDCTTAESADLEAIATCTRNERWSERFSDGETVRQLEQEMLSGHVEGQALKMFVSMTRAKRILDIGMFTGYSALAMAEALPPDGTLLACEVDSYVAEMARSLFDRSLHGSKIEIAIAPALETLRKLAASGETFDFVFIDADKKEYVQYFQVLLDSNLLPPDGFICVDNTLLQGQAYLPNPSANGAAIREFNRVVQSDPRVEQVLLPLRDGVTLIRRVS
ncbi:class I SAM-dependent methyltransferase [Microcoleus sp. FACHB-1515]|uniref:O-methyltransferase n=1 Tax=Cyanophyceae TaxID=3028117 RepID=UPI001683FD9F|nr:class I SAM-dependent methyltransferase [Microcoleus sp. FACHB-1515]MBD2092594.1 class I SAM-dependent methyltransferase [Microcoleus sp. FACHB-1515]